MTDHYNTFIATFNLLIATVKLERNCEEKEAIEKYIMPWFTKELNRRKVGILTKNEMDILHKSVNSLKVSDNELETIKSIIKTLEDLMHGNN